MHVFVYRWDRDFCVYVEGRKEADNPCGLLLQIQISCVCIRPNLLYPSQPPNSSHALHFFWTLGLNLNTYSLSSGHKFFLCFTFFILPRRDILCHWLPLSAWGPLGNDPSRSIPVATSDIISLLQFWFLWLIVHDIYVHHTYVSCSSLICWWRFCSLCWEYCE